MTLHARGSWAGSPGGAGPGECCAGSGCPSGLLEPDNEPAGSAVHGDPIPVPGAWGAHRGAQPRLTRA
eukprot:8531162-Lingulodinium_polyedra.AAC.1